jgi:hypothetical protein
MKIQSEMGASQRGPETRNNRREKPSNEESTAFGAIAKQRLVKTQQTKKT